MQNSAEKVIDSWLTLQSQLVVGTLRAVVLVGDPGAGQLLPVAA